MTFPPETSMVERVKAAMGCTNDEQCLADHKPWRCYDCTEKARAAIAAMREPTPAISAAFHRAMPAHSGAVWRAMIDAALERK